MELTVGTPAPEFSMPDEQGQIHSLADYKGKPVVLFFYPEDDTPGCTKEACNFRDDFSQYQAEGAILLGISPDDSNSHQAFKSKYNLPFSLLADEGHKVCEQYGVWGPKKLFGLKYEGLIRTTFLVDGQGIISEIFTVNKIAPHSQTVLQALQALEV